MIVTKFKYPLEKELVNKLDLMCDRCTTNKSKKDSVLINEGEEGEGKTTLSVAEAYYISEKTKRKFGAENVFFDIEKMIIFAQSTKEQIIIWDEPALQALSTDWATKAVRNITRLLMMVRKKRHFFIFNLTKFYKFNEYIVVDRPMALIHVYSRRNKESGRFIYIKKKNLELLWRDYKSSKKRNYKQYASRKVRGTFPDILNSNYNNNVLSEFDMENYERNKDEAIQSVGKDKNISKSKQRWLEQRDNMIRLTKKVLKLNNTQLAIKLDEFGVIIDKNTIQEIVRVPLPTSLPPL